MQFLKWNDGFRVARRYERPSRSPAGVDLGGSRKSFRFVCAAALVSAGLIMTAPARAGFVTYHSQPDFQAAVGGPTQLTVFHFDGPTETNGKAANNPTIVPSYSSQGVDFLPFTGTSVFPTIARGQGFQIPDPNRDGLLVNAASPNPTSDLDGRAIKFDFHIPARSVGVFTNKLLDGDGGFLQAFDPSMNLIGQVNIDPGIFAGIVTDRDISRVSIVNTFNSDITFGIYDLQFSRNGLQAVPEPASILLLSSGVLGMIGYRWRRRSVG